MKNRIVLNGPSVVLVLCLALVPLLPACKSSEEHPKSEHPTKEHPTQESSTNKPPAKP